MSKSIEMRVEELENLVFLSKNVLSFEEASKFLNLSKSYLYKLTSGNLIPHYKPQGKMLYFEKAELEAWLRQNPSSKDNRHLRCTARNTLGKWLYYRHIGKFQCIYR